jgi:SAM-dependent MidA family methyltransferase
MDGNEALIAAIRREIERGDGRITFARFMELALYHPQYGYYTGSNVEDHEAARAASAPCQRPDGVDAIGRAGQARRPRIGTEGDYFTSVSVGPLFGRILARQFVRWLAEMGEPPEFEVVEFGGHRGQLKEDVLATAPDLRYRIEEVGTDRRAVRDSLSHGAPGGRALPESITGVVFSNEFLDALPVHRVCVGQGQWQEVYVTVARASSLRNQPRGKLEACPTILAETLGPLSTPRLADFLAGLPVHLMEGYQTEVNLRALDWLEAIARRLKRGFVLTIDYGYEREDYFSPQHRNGTLLCYHRHTKNDDPYQHIGEQDITAHVEFTSLIERGKRLGLEPVLFTDQSHFLLQIGESEIAEIVERTAGQLSKERQAIHQLIHPELMGRTFKVLVQKKA